MVYFVGAGPGAPDLITLRGLKLIQNADIIIYAGSLVNRELLNYAEKKCEIYDSSKMTLEECAYVMERAEIENKILVRLHTGDPSIYGAIKEQMDFLSSKGIDYEVCPGVSSFSGAAAAIKAEYTLPEVSQTVILTRASGRTSVPEKESLKELAKHRASMAIFLSSSMAQKVSDELIEGGYSPETPAAIVYKATWPDEKIILTKLSELNKCAVENNINKTALILVGDFIKTTEYERSKLYHPEFSHCFRKAMKGTN